MTQRAVAPDRSGKASVRRHLPPLAILLLGATCCATALGATSSMTACDRTTDLQSLQVPDSDLTANVVGHIVVESDDENDESQNALPAQDRSAAPMLYLAPRIAVILQDVFSAVAIETPLSDAPDRAQPFAIGSLLQDEFPQSPVAGDAAQPNSSEPTDPASAIEDVDTGSSIQRQMFRTDI